MITPLVSSNSSLVFPSIYQRGNQNLLIEGKTKEEFEDIKGVIRIYK
jgi:hypothetical protein